MDKLKNRLSKIKDINKKENMLRVYSNIVI